MIDYLEVSSEKNRDNRFTKEDVLSVSGEYGIVNQIEFQGRSFAGASVSNYGVVENGDVVYTKSPLKSNPYGIIKTNKGIPGIVSTLYAVYKPKEITDSKFVQIYFELDSRMNSYMHPLVNKGAKNDMKVSAENALKGMVSFPKKDEQEMISLYFSTLDNLITLHQRKCEQTKKLKKYMLQKMFPQNGAKVPEIRFDGFTYDWEQRKLSDVLDIVTKRNGEKYGKEEVLSVSDEYGCINQIKFQGRSFAGEDISNYKIVDTGDIIYTRSPLKSKPYGIIKVVGDEIGIVSPLYIVNKVKEGNNSQFIYRVFDSPEKTNKYLSPLVRKGAKNTMNISNDEWLSGKIDVAPSYEEQYQIGLYFDHLDNLITLHQRQCDELKKMKKYMLQNMFI